MKFLSAFFLLAVAIGAQAQDTKPAPEADKKPAAAPALDPAALKERVSYFYGADVARHLKDNGVDVSVETFIQGLKDTIEGAKAKYPEAELEAAMNQFAEAMVARQKQEMSAVGDKNAKEGEDFLAANGKRKEVTTTASGLQYEVLKAGDGPKPTAEQIVSVHYHGTLVNGKVFDSSVQRGEPATFPVNGVIPGWVEALQLMPVGSKWKLVIPAKLAYGDRGAGRDIGPNSTLIFEVELLKIQPK